MSPSTFGDLSYCEYGKLSSSGNELYTQVENWHEADYAGLGPKSDGVLRVLRTCVVISDDGHTWKIVPTLLYDFSEKLTPVRRTTVNP